MVEIDTSGLLTRLQAHSTSARKVPTTVRFWDYTLDRVSTQCERLKVKQSDMIEELVTAALDALENAALPTENGSGRKDA